MEISIPDTYESEPSGPAPNRMQSLEKQTDEVNSNSARQSDIQYEHKRATLTGGIQFPQYSKKNLYRPLPIERTRRGAGLWSLVLV